MFNVPSTAEMPWHAMAPGARLGFLLSPNEQVSNLELRDPDSDRLAHAAVARLARLARLASLPVLCKACPYPFPLHHPHST